TLEGALLLPRGGVPHDQGMIVAAGDYFVAGGYERHHGDGTGMPLERELLLAGLDVPELHALVCDRGQSFAVRTEGQALNPGRYRGRGGFVKFLGTAGSEADQAANETRRQGEKEARTESDWV